MVYDRCDDAFKKNLEIGALQAKIEQMEIEVECPDCGEKHLIKVYQSPLCEKCKERINKSMNSQK